MAAARKTGAQRAEISKQAGLHTLCHTHDTDPLQQATRSSRANSGGNYLQASANLLAHGPKVSHWLIGIQ
jgi:hypothetical protein